MRLSTTCFAVLITLVCCRHASAYEAPEIQPASDPALQGLVNPAGSELRDYLEAINVATGKGFIVVGGSLSEATMGSFRGKPAGQMMAAAAARLKSKWRKEGDFYLLYPPTMVRHDAKPVSQVETFKELKRVIPRNCENELLELAVAQMGRAVNLPVIGYGPATSPDIAKRSFMGGLIVAKGRTVDEAMQALTAVTGDPWDYWQDAHILSSFGRRLTGDERRLVQEAIASVKLTRSLTKDQRRRVDAPDGLRISELPLPQRNFLIAATALMRAKRGVAADAIVLHNSPRAPHLGPADYIDVYAATPNGLIRLGSLGNP